MHTPRLIPDAPAFRVDSADGYRDVFHTLAAAEQKAETLRDHKEVLITQWTNGLYHTVARYSFGQKMIRNDRYRSR